MRVAECVLLSVLAMSGTPAAEIVLQGSFSGRPIPRWQNGHVLAVLPDRQTVEVYDEAGVRHRVIAPSIPGAASYQVRDVAARTDGTVAVALHSRDPLGKIANLIGWYSPTGDQDRLVVTGSFAAMRVAFTADGTLWASGRDHDESLDSIRSRDVLRRYDRDGRLAGTNLNSDTLRYNPRSHPSGESMLVSGGEAVAFISLTANVVVIVGRDGVEIERRATPPRAEGEFISGAAFVEGGDIVCSVQGPEHVRFMVLSSGQNWLDATSQFRAQSSYVVIGSANGRAVTYGGGRIGFASVR